MKQNVLTCLILATMGILAEAGGAKGVNIGGWLVLEPWITPSLFPNENTVDEWTFCQNDEDAANKLKTHWDTWATAAEFKKIKSAGFNIVRIPIGYWAYEKLGDEPYITGADAYLEKAIGWAKNSGLKVMIDLHGAPGSQNGFDNSGQRTTTPQFTQKANIDLTIKVLQKITDKYAADPTVDGIAILNEPKPDVLGNGALDAINDFNAQAISTVGGKTAVLVSDAFQGVQAWQGKFNGGSGAGAGAGARASGNQSSAHKVIVDHHTYQVFDDGSLGMSAEKHNEQAAAEATASASTTDTPVIIGEFSGAMTDCAKYLNGRTDGARWDGTFKNDEGLGKKCPAAANSKDEFAKDQTMMDQTKAFIGAQTSAFTAKTNGWFFWTFKTENAPEWDALFLSEKGLFPM